MIKIALYQPEIAGNVGSIIRSCACFGCELHIIEPCGFPFDQKRVKKSALDYFDKIILKRHESFEEFLKNEIKTNQTKKEPQSEEENFKTNSKACNQTKGLESSNDFRTCSKSRFGELDMQHFLASEAKLIKTYDERGSAENVVEIAAKGRDFEQVLSLNTCPPRLILASTKGSKNALKFEFRDGDFVIFGQESSGVPAEVAEMCDSKIFIPMKNQLRSLNVAVSCGIILALASKSKM